MNPGTDEILKLFRGVHQKVRQDMADVDGALLNWHPGPLTNSVGALVDHIAQTEKRNLGRVLGPVAERDSQELSDRAYSRADLLQILAAADAQLDEFSVSLTSEVLSRIVQHPHRGPSSAFILAIETYGHVKEHFGHLELTLQLAREHGRTPAGAETATPEG